MILLKRFGWRLLWSSLLSVVAFGTMQPLTELTGVPEVARVLPAIAVMYWIEYALFVGRVVISPGVDLQVLKRKAAETPNGAAVMAILTSVNVLVRLIALLCIIYLA